MFKHLQRIFKDPIGGLMHVASALAAALGVFILWRSSPPDGLARPAALIYGFSLVLQFAASSAYHLIKTTPYRESLLRRLDHVAIFLLIAGTYTPIGVIVFTGVWRSAILIAIWSIAAAGILFKLFFIKAPTWLSVGIYVMMGWLGFLGFAQLIQALPLAGLGWLVGGGLLYTSGAVIYATRRPNFFPGVFGFHEVWHLFVSAASAAHYVFILGYVLPHAVH
jgi:hemolysin III